MRNRNKLSLKEKLYRGAAIGTLGATAFGLTGCGGGEEAPTPSADKDPSTQSASANLGASETGTQAERYSNEKIAAMAAALTPDKLRTMTPAEITAAATITHEMASTPLAAAEAFTVCQEALVNAGGTHEEITEWFNTQAGGGLGYANMIIDKYTDPILKGCHLGIQESFLRDTHGGRQWMASDSTKTGALDYRVNFNVVPGSVKQTADTLEYQYRITDNSSRPDLHPTYDITVGVELSGYKNGPKGPNYSLARQSEISRNMQPATAS